MLVIFVSIPKPLREQFTHDFRDVNLCSAGLTAFRPIGRQKSMAEDSSMKYRIKAQNSLVAHFPD